MYLKTEGIVLRETEYKDADKLLTVLTKDRGQLTLRARGVRSRSSKLKVGCQLLAYSEFTVFENRGYMTVNEASPLELFAPLREDIELLSLASYFAQVAEVLSQEDEPNGVLLSLLLNCLYALAKLKKPQTLVKGVFELRAACIAGYEPDLSGCERCGQQMPDRFLISAGALQCAGCAAGVDGLRLPVGAGVLTAMRYIVFCEMKKLFSFSLSDQAMDELSSLTEAYLLTQLERGFYTLDFYKSLQIT